MQKCIDLDQCLPRKWPVKMAEKLKNIILTIFIGHFLGKCKVTNLFEQTSRTWYFSDDDISITSFCGVRNIGTNIIYMKYCYYCVIILMCNVSLVTALNVQFLLLKDLQETISRIIIFWLAENTSRSRLVHLTSWC